LSSVFYNVYTIKTYVLTIVLNYLLIQLKHQRYGIKQAHSGDVIYKNLLPYH